MLNLLHPTIESQTLIADRQSRCDGLLWGYIAPITLASLVSSILKIGVHQTRREAKLFYFAGAPLTSNYATQRTYLRTKDKWVALGMAI